MINLKIDYDIILKAEDILKLDQDFPGVYVLLDEKNTPIYIGQSQKVRGRVRNHTNGHTNVKPFHKEIKKVALIYEDDLEKRLIAELYLTRTLQGLKVFEQPYPHEKKRIKIGFGGVRVFGDCQFTRGSYSCGIPAHSNGYCHKHGGDGLTLSLIQQRAVEDFLRRQGVKEK